MEINTHEHALERNNPVSYKPHVYTFNCCREVFGVSDGRTKLMTFEI